MSDEAKRKAISTTSFYVATAFGLAVSSGIVAVITGDFGAAFASGGAAFIWMYMMFGGAMWAVDAIVRED